MTRALMLLGLVSLAINQAYAEEQRVSFGDRQVAQLLDDRPSMKDVLSPKHPIYHWVVEKFETGALGDRVYWDHHEPISGAGHVYSRPTVVRVTSDPSVSGRDKWGMLIFEMFNLQWAEHRTRLSAQAARDDIGKSKFATEQMRLEVRALRETQEFFRGSPLPNAKRDKDTFYFGLLRTDTRFDAYLRFLDTDASGDYDPREYFADIYERIQQYDRAKPRRGSKRQPRPAELTREPE